MIGESCIGPGLDSSKISPEAEITGASYLTGPRTRVGPGAVIVDSRLHDVVVEAGARIVDSIIVAEGEPHSHNCDAAGRTVVSGAAPQVGPDARVSGSTLINSAIGPGATIDSSWAKDCRLGPRAVVTRAKLVLASTGPRVTIAGPTEVSEAYVGHGATIETRGYYEGIFSNAFRKLKFDESSGRLKVAETIELPHVSRYGLNTINSTNSGKLRRQPDGVFRDFGTHGGLWHDPLLSHEQIELGPACWVAPWTKVVGQSGIAHATDEEMVNDELMTYVMPFAVAGVDGQQTRGLVMPGELSVGIGPKQRKGAWTFTYAPDAVIRMVGRLHESLEPDRKHVADTIVEDALRTAIEMTKALAARKGADLAVPHADQRRGWPRWIGKTHALLRAHLDAELWRFADGRPVEWRLEAGRWTHPRFDAVLALAPDALDKRVSEEEMLACEDTLPTPAAAVRSIEGAGGGVEIHPEADVAADAVVGPGCRIGPGCVVESGAMLWNSVLDKATVGAGARIERSIVEGGSVAAGATIRSCRVIDSVIGAESTADEATVLRSRLAERTTVSAFADVRDVECDHATILGGACHHADIDVHLMSMHMAGWCQHLKAVPTPVELEGNRIDVPTIPMLGGGSRVMGAPGRPVEMECSFIGSNSLIEAGCYVGFGCFVLGTVGPDQGLLPFTLTTGGGPDRHVIGGVLASLPSTIITHFVSWTFQNTGPQLAPAVAEMTRQAIQTGIEAIECELAGRSGGRQSDGDGPFARYKSLTHYTPEQIEAGLRTYRRALDSGAWDIVFEEARLRVRRETGCWVEREGSVKWKAVPPGAERRT